MRNYFNAQFTIKFVIILIFLVIVKEVLLINEELLLIASFIFFVYTTYNIFSYLLSQELQSYITSISLMFSQLLEMKKKNLTALISVYRYVTKIKALITQSSVYTSINSEIIEKNNSIQLLDIRNVVVEDQLRTLMAEEVQLLKMISMSKIKFLDMHLASEPIEEFTSMVLDTFDEDVVK